MSFRDELEAIRARVNAATPDSWDWGGAPFVRVRRPDVLALLDTVEAMLRDIRSDYASADEWADELWAEYKSKAETRPPDASKTPHQARRNDL